MKSLILLAASVLLFTTAFAEEGFTDLFNGTSLTGWDGDPSLWSVEDGAIVGQTTDPKQISYNQFLTWKNGEVDDFELKLQFKVDAGNTGVQIRSFMGNQPYQVRGYQADIDASNNWSGTLYGEGFGGILAKRGEKALRKGEKPEVLESIGDPAELASGIRKGEWNDYHIKATGYRIQIFINGTLMSDFTDESEMRRRGGKLAFQLHVGDPMKVSFKNIRLKRLPLTDVKKVVLVAGAPSHPPRTHEHNAGMLLAAKLLNENQSDKLYAAVYTNGWPEDTTAFDHADAVVMFADGGMRHPAFTKLKVLEKLRSRKVGIGAIHYAVEMTPGASNDELIRCIGGAFEINYSVNPHWDANFESFPDHPVANGLKPFITNDEWYFNMRFAEGMKGVTPILSAIPPAETMKRPDGKHSGNPTVRKMVEAKTPQHLCWVYERPDGGRGFGATGAHYHDNWAVDSYRTAVYNAIAWIAGIEIPEGGIKTPTPGKAELDANLDPKPARKPKPKKKKAA